MFLSRLFNAFRSAAEACEGLAEDVNEVRSRIRQGLLNSNGQEQPALPEPVKAVENGKRSKAKVTTTA